MILLSWFRALCRFFRWQLYVLFHYLDPLTSEEPKAVSRRSKWNTTFLFPFLAILLPTLYGNILLPYLAGVPLTWGQLYASPGLFFRQMYPRAMWAHTDIGISICILAALTNYASFWDNSWTLDRYWNAATEAQPRLRIGKATLDGESSVRILAHHRRIKRPSFVSNAALDLIAIVFIFTNVYFNAFYSLLDVSFLLTCICISFIFVIYLYHVLFGIVVFIILANVFFQVRQKAALSAMNSLNGQLKRLQYKRKKRYVKRMVALFKYQNGKLNQAVLVICIHIQEYANFWCASLTVFFACHVTLQSYLLYICAFIHTLSLAQKILFLGAISETVLLLFLLINLCARVVKLNRDIEVAYRRFYWSLLKLGTFSRANLCYMLKVESLAIGKRLKPYAFRLFDNYRITSKTFYMVISQISCVFFLVFKKSTN